MAELSKKSTKKRAEKISSRTLKLRDQLWPDLDEGRLWIRTKAKGFTTIPRALPHIFEILDDLGGKGTPLSRVYFSLWCRVFDESVIELKSYNELAYEGGFSGQRAVTQWKQRMAKLVELGFILAEEGPGGSYDYILLLNPYLIVKKYYDSGAIQKTKFIALFNRVQEIGAKDME